MKTRREIDEQLRMAAPYTDGERESPRFGMSYEEGVEAALLWVLGDADDAPLGDMEEDALQ